MRDSRQHFLTLHQSGTAGETAVRRCYEQYGYTYIASNHDARYDLEFLTPRGLQMFAEVKTDCTTSENLAIEICCRGKPSGILATTAHHFCVYFAQSGELWLFKAAELRDYICQTPLRTAQVRVFSDTNTQVKLLPKRLAATLPFARRTRLAAQPHLKAAAQLSAVS